MTTGSALPTLPQSVPRGRSISWLHWFASATACQVACPPVRIRLGYFPSHRGLLLLRLSTDRSSSPLLDITTTATGLLVWGFFCQEVLAERPIFFPSSVSLFDLKARLFIPTRHSGKLTRAGAVKAGRLFGDPPAGLGLESSEHGCTIECSRANQQETIRGSPRSSADIAPQPCIRWVQGLSCTDCVWIRFSERIF